MANIYNKIVGFFSNKYFAIICLVLIFTYLSIPSISINYISENLKVERLDGFYQITLPKKNYSFKVPYSTVKTGIDINGGIVLQYDADVSKLDEAEKVEALKNVKNILEQRVVNLGISEANVVTSVFNDEYRLNIELPGFENIETAKQTLGQTAKLDFRIENTINAEKVRQESEVLNEEYSLLLSKLQEDSTNLTDEDQQQYFEYLTKRQQILVNNPVYEKLNPELTGQDLEKATVQVNSSTGLNEVVVSLQFNEEGKEKFRKITAENVGKQLAVYLDDKIVQAPRISQEIPSGEAQISGGFNFEQANAFKDQLNAGALPVPVTVINEKYIGPFLGLDTVQKSLLAGIIGLMLVVVFMAINYRSKVFISLLNIFLYTTISLFLYKVTGTALTLPGIAGFILSIGLALDSNVLIFERLKEEEIINSDHDHAVENALSRSFTSIKDANIATFIAAMVLYNPFNFGFLPVSPLVKGFSITLAYGVIVGLFTGYYITRLILKK